MQTYIYGRERRAELPIARSRCCQARGVEVTAATAIACGTTRSSAPCSTPGGVYQIVHLSNDGTPLRRSRRPEARPHPSVQFQPTKVCNFNRR